ncbi:MAG: hypothetical protein ACREQD_08010, partial [Candidatus Binataceae bacterium]
MTDGISHEIDIIGVARKNRSRAAICERQLLTEIRRATGRIVSRLMPDSAPPFADLGLGVV